MENTVITAQPTLNFVDLIENNPVTKLSHTCNGIMLTKIKNTFSEFEQQLFVSSFYCYLNYNPKMDFVIDLDDVWKWIGFSQKINARTLLEKNFTIDIDYTCNLLLQQKQTKRGGGNIKKIMLTVKTFKSLCLKAGTKKADEIHDYYMKMEEILQEAVQEESAELKQQLQQTSAQLADTVTQLHEKDAQTQQEKNKIREKTLLEQFPSNVQCVYYGRIDNTSTIGEPLIKFGMSNSLNRRVGEHKANFTNFCLMNAFKVSNHIQIENAIKRHPVLKNITRNIIINNRNNTELLSINKTTLEEIDAIINTIINETEYNIENYNLLMEKNYDLEQTLTQLKNEAKEKDEKIAQLEDKLKDFTPNTSYKEKQLKRLSLTNVTSNRYLLYAFMCKPDRYKCGYCRPADLENRINIFKSCDPAGEMKCTQKINFPFIDKIMTYLLKTHLTTLGNETYDGALNDIQLIFDIASKIDEFFVGNVSLQDILDKLNAIYVKLFANNINPDIPQVKKSKRPVDQINPETGEIIASYPSTESAGLALGLTTGTAIGLARRNNRLCQGFLWRFSGISPEDQMKDQPVMKICCKNGKIMRFPNIAAAARDANISAPGMRSRILTDVHTNNHHWTFDVGASHYTHDLPVPDPDPILCALVAP